MGVDRRPDGAMLEGACTNYARAVQAELIIDREGPTFSESVITESGDVVVLRVKAHPAVAIARQRWMLVKTFATEFGLSPVSRTRLANEKAGDNKGEDDLVKLLSQPRAERAALVQ